jgi:hypothetical protein
VSYQSWTALLEGPCWLPSPQVISQCHRCLEDCFALGAAIGSKALTCPAPLDAADGGAALRRGLLPGVPLLSAGGAATQVRAGHASSRQPAEVGAALSCGAVLRCRHTHYHGTSHTLPCPSWGCCPTPVFVPRSWHSPLDTALVPAHFEKQRVGSGAQKQQLSKMGALKSKGQGASAAGGAQPQQHGGAVGGGALKPGSPGAKGAVGNVVSAVSARCCCWLVGVSHTWQAGCPEGANTSLSSNAPCFRWPHLQVVKGATKGGGPRGSRRHRQPELPPNVVVAHLGEGDGGAAPGAEQRCLLVHAAVGKQCMVGRACAMVGRAC